VEALGQELKTIYSHLAVVVFDTAITHGCIDAYFVIPINRQLGTTVGARIEEGWGDEWSTVDR